MACSRHPGSALVTSGRGGGRLAEVSEQIVPGDAAADSGAAADRTRDDGERDESRRHNAQNALHGHHEHLSKRGDEGVDSQCREDIYNHKHERSAAYMIILHYTRCKIIRILDKVEPRAGTHQSIESVSQTARNQHTTGERSRRPY